MLGGHGYSDAGSQQRTHHGEPEGIRRVHQTKFTLPGAGADQQAIGLSPRRQFFRTRLERPQRLFQVASRRIELAVVGVLRDDERLSYH